MDIYKLDRKSSAPPLHVCTDEEFGLHLTDGIGIIAKIGPCGPPDAEDRANAAMLANPYALSTECPAWWSVRPSGAERLEWSSAEPAMATA